MERNSLDAGMYIIDKNYELLYLNEKVKVLYPEIRVGDICYKALGCQDLPCAHCPIRSVTGQESFFYSEYRKEWITASAADMMIPERGECYNIQFRLKREETEVPVLPLEESSQSIITELEKNSGRTGFAGDCHEEEIPVECYRELLRQNKHLKEQLEQAMLNAETANRAKSTFLFNMSHDIRTPMNAIIGFSDMIARKPGEEEVVIRCVNKIKKSSDILLKLINGVLDLARIESDKAKLDLAARDIYSAIENLQMLFDDSMKHAGIDFIVEINVEHAFVMCDDLKMTQVLVNLLSNALKFTPRGGKITLHIEQAAIEGGVAEYIISVKDTGIGMSEDFCNRAFQEFERENDYTDGDIEGAGLGLAIVKRLIDLMGGKIRLISKLGEGTEVVIRLKFELADRIEQEVNHDKIDRKMDFTGRRVLLVEDNELNREFGYEILTEQGLIVELAENGVEAIDKVSHSQPGYYDLILMDIQMPVMDGYTATREIRRLQDLQLAEIPILALTASAFQEDIQKCFNAGMNGHIAKPIDIIKLKDMLYEMLK